MPNGRISYIASALSAMYGDAPMAAPSVSVESSASFAAEVRALMLTRAAPAGMITWVTLPGVALSVMFAIAGSGDAMVVATGYTDAQVPPTPPAMHRSVTPFPLAVENAALAAAPLIVPPVGG